jgi:tetratricopeptide (TPR) repeat protein
LALQFSLALLFTIDTIKVSAVYSPADKMLASARDNARSGRNCELALKQADQLIASNPNMTDAYFVKAQCEDYMFGADRAIGTLQLALHRNLQSFEIWKMLGTLYDAKRNYEAAVKAYSSALLISPRDQETHHLRAMAYTELKKPDLAIADMTMCINLAPDKGRHYEWRACAYEQKQQWNEALADLNKAVSLCDTAHKGQFLSHRAEVLVKLNRMKDAIDDYDTLLKANSMDDAFWLKRGDCCMAIGNYKEAVKSYSETISLDDSSTAYFARSKAYAKLGQNDLSMKDKAAGDHLLRQKAINPI